MRKVLALGAAAVLTLGLSAAALAGNGLEKEHHAKPLDDRRLRRRSVRPHPSGHEPAGGDARLHRLDQLRS